MIYELRRNGGGPGLAAICSGGGQGDALLIEGPPLRPGDAPGSSSDPADGRARDDRGGADAPVRVRGGVGRGRRERLRKRIEHSGKLVDGWLDLGIEADGRLVGDITARSPKNALPPGVFEVGITLFDPDRDRGVGRSDRGHDDASVRGGGRRTRAGDDGGRQRRDAPRAGRLGFVHEGPCRRSRRARRPRGLRHVRGYSERLGGSSTSMTGWSTAASPTFRPTADRSRRCACRPRSARRRDRRPVDPRALAAQQGTARARRGRSRTPSLAWYPNVRSVSPLTASSVGLSATLRRVQLSVSTIARPAAAFSPPRSPFR